MTGFAYDAQRRLTTTTFPSTLAESYTYDAVGNLLTKTDRNGNTITYGYDFANRLKSKSYPDVTSVAYTYDLAGRLTQASDPTGTYAIAYDNLGRLKEADTTYTFLPSRTLAVKSTYDLASNRLTLSNAESSVLSFTYDTLNRLSGISGGGGHAFSYAYDALSRVTQIARSVGRNNMNSNYVYDSMSRLTSLANDWVGTYSYTYDAVGNKLTAVSPGLNPWNRTYTYDNIYQLTAVAQTGAPYNGNESYIYDAVGNRTSSLSIPSYTVDNSNHLTAMTGAAYTYDNNGNTLTKTDSSGTTTYTSDFENRLVTATRPGAATVTFRYDPFGRRIEKNSQIYVYDGASIIEDLNSSGTSTATYHYGPGVDDLIEYDSHPVFQDGLGSVVQTETTASHPTWWDLFNYDSFGNNAGPNYTNLDNLRFQYTGRENDSETGLYYYRARYYDPTAGRFLSEDPIGFGGKDVNFYRYVSNQPTGSDDPFGLRLNPKPGLGSQGGIDLTNYYAALTFLGQDPRAAQMIALLNNSSTTYNVVFTHDGNDQYDNSTHTIFWDPLSALYCTCGGAQTPANGLYHEMAHAAGWGPGTPRLIDTPDLNYTNLEEKRVIHSYETPFARRHGECVRHDHAGQPFDVTSPTSTIFIVPPVLKPPLPPGLQ